MTGTVAAIWQPPFSMAGAVMRQIQPGATLATMAAEMAVLPPDFDRRGIIMVSGHEVIRDNWHKVKPKPGTSVTFHYPLAGGGGGGNRSGKAALAVVLAIATILTAGAAAGGFFATSGGLFLAGSTSAKVLAAGISFAGQLAIGAITNSPVSEAQSGGQ